MSDGPNAPVKRCLERTRRERDQGRRSAAWPDENPAPRRPMPGTAPPSTARPCSRQSAAPRPTAEAVPASLGDPAEPDGVGKFPALTASARDALAGQALSRAWVAFASSTVPTLRPCRDFGSVDWRCPAPRACKASSQIGGLKNAAGCGSGEPEPSCRRDAIALACTVLLPRHNSPQLSSCTFTKLC
jgi:hypothetical protein